MSITPDTIVQILGGIAALVALVRGKKYVDDKVTAAGALLDRARALARASVKQYLPYVGVWPEEQIRARLFAAIDRIAGALRITLTPKQRIDLEQVMEEELLVASFSLPAEALKAAREPAGAFLDPKGRG